MSKYPPTTIANRGVFWPGIGLISIAIVLCRLIFLLILIDVIVTAIYGFADWFGLRINVVLAFGVVLTMVFITHIGRSFALTFVTEKDKKSSMKSDGTLLPGQKFVI